MDYAKSVESDLRNLLAEILNIDERDRRIDRLMTLLSTYIGHVVQDHLDRLNS